MQLSESQVEAVREQMNLKLRKWRKPALELVTTCTTINKWLSEKYGFESSFEDLQQLFISDYVTTGFFSLEESGFLDKKQRYPYYKYKKLKKVGKAA